MATPIGHSIVGYTLARSAGLRSRPALALAIGAANLPDVDFALGYVANGDVYSLHHEVITHRPVFPLLVGIAAGVGSAAVSLVTGRGPSPWRALRTGALAATLVGSHLAMDPLPLPYDSFSPKPERFWPIIASEAWNAVIDIAVYGGMAMAVLSRENADARSGNGKVVANGATA
ncbi:MAG: metal-dependent hydrolase [Dehalococcoidia bacterium]